LLQFILLKQDLTKDISILRSLIVISGNIAKDRLGLFAASLKSLPVFVTCIHLYLFPMQVTSTNHHLCTYYFFYLNVCNLLKKLKMCHYGQTV